MITKTSKLKNEHSIRTMRSINISLDINNPERLVGYVPTQKSVTLSREIFNSLLGMTNTRAFCIGAPYGSGKSSVGLLWCLLAERGNKLSNVIKPFADALNFNIENEINPFIKFARQKRPGLAIALNGYSVDVVTSIRVALYEALERNNLNGLAEKVKKLPKSLDGLFSALTLVSETASGSRGSILIVWDEFGKVLEHCVAAGDSKALFEIQSIAEFASRSSATFPIVLALLVHQSFARYASALPNYLKTEWSKIEGRFKQINYIEDSKEIYELIGQIISRQIGNPCKDRTIFSVLAKNCHSVGIFKEFDLSSLEDLLWSAAPLSPLSLYLLPRLSGRVAQNERTLFTFIYSDDANALHSIKDQWVTPAHLYDFFSDLMRLDTAIGGTHRNWVETNLALNKVSDPLKQILLKSLSCIRIAGTQGSVVGNDRVLALSVGTVETKDASKIRNSLQDLLREKIVFYRRISDDYTIWQGTDVDIRSAIEEVKGKFDASLDMYEFLNGEYPPPFRSPQRYNDIRAISRYFDGKYVRPSDLPSLLNWELTLNNDPVRDGRILYAVAETKEELLNARQIASECQLKQIVVAIPRKPLSIRDTVLELKAYYYLLNDGEFCGRDPIVEQELKQLADDCEMFLKSQLDHLLIPSETGPIFYYRSQVFDKIISTGGLKRILSEICDKVFRHTPRFNNEMINRAEPSAQIVNARKKLLRALLDDPKDEGFNLEGYGPEVAIFRAIYLRTGLYRRSKAGTWGFYPELDGSNSSLSKIWDLFIDYWRTPSESPKQTIALLQTLTDPPFGLREGIIPLLLAASFKASNSPVSILEDGIYVKELKAETFERLARSPRSFVVTVPTVSEDLGKYLDSIVRIFKQGQVQKGGNRIRYTVECIMNWVKSLPPVAIQKGMASQETDEFLDLITTALDPIKLLKEDFLRVSRSGSYSEVLIWLQKRKEEMEQVEPTLLFRVRELCFRSIGAIEQGALADTLRQWRHSLPGRADAYLTDRMMAGFLTRIEQEYASEADLLLSIASHLTGKSLRYWDHNNLPQFDLCLLQTMKKIEDLADTLDLEAATLVEVENISIPWTERRLKTQLQALSKKLGLKRTKIILDNLLSEIQS